jgi:hypothetical protein
MKYLDQNKEHSLFLGSTQSELPLLDHQHLMASPEYPQTMTSNEFPQTMTSHEYPQTMTSHEYPQDFGLPRTAPSRSTNFPDYVQLSSLLGRASQHHAWSVRCLSMTYSFENLYPLSLTFKLKMQLKFNGKLLKPASWVCD